MSHIQSTKRSARQIFTTALGLNDPTGREACLDEACGADTELRREVERLLAARLDEGSSPLDAMEAAFGPERTAAPTPWFDAREGHQQMIGPYKLLEQIGEGGFGVVYMAEQTAPVRRRVALKIIKPGMDTKEVIARFEAERQALAMMDHPNIARILDGGATEHGRPYFVMELVRGIPLTQYCDEARLTTLERLELFIAVCRAIQHAHQKGIIHRDLKPSNVMVTMHDDKAVIKVIDFGIAKALSQPLTDRTLFTGYQQLLGTPLYMSPEQVQMTGIDVDTRSDVYSLGVLLYELLTGTTPFTKESLANVGFDELRRIIREQEPLKPSARITTLSAADRSTIADRRQIDQRKVTAQLRGELDWIAMKALEKDRNRRYESPSALAADIECYLKNEPVLACPPTFVYRLKKYLLRHRMGVSWGLAAVAVVLICGTLIAYPRYQESHRIGGVRQQVELALRAAATAIEAGDLALAEKPIANAIALVGQDEGSLSDLSIRVEALSTELGQRMSGQARYDELLARARDAQDRMTYGKHLKGDAAAELTLSASFSVLERDDWLQYLESAYLSPEQNARAQETIYETLLCLADHGPRWMRTAESANRSLELLERAEGFHPSTKALHWVRSECHRVLDETEARDQALVLYNATRAVTALDHYLPGHTAGWRGDRAAAIEAYRAALRVQPDHYNSLFFLADRLKAEKRFDEAIAYFTGCIALRPDHVFAMINRAEAYEKSGDKDSAELDFRAASEANASNNDHVYALGLLLEFYRRSFQHEQHAAAVARLLSESERLISEQTTQTGPDDLSTLALIEELGVLLCNAGEFKDGIPLLERVLERRRSLFQTANESTLLSLTDLGECLVGSDRVIEAIGLLEEALAMSKALHGPDHPTTLMVMSKLGLQFANTGRADQGVSLLEDAFAKFEKMDDSENRGNTMEHLGWAYKQACMWDKAIPLLRESLAHRVRDLGPEHDSTLVATWLLGSALDQAGQSNSAVPLLEESLEKHVRQLGADATRTLLVLNDLAVAFINVGRAVDAIPLLIRCAEVRRRDHGPEHGTTRVATYNLGFAYLMAEQYEEAVDLFEQLLESNNRLLGADHPESLQASSGLLEAYRLTNRRDEGRRLALSRLEIVRTQSNEILLSSALAVATEAMLTFGEHADAEPLARECLRIREARLPDTWLRFNAASLLGGALLGQDQYEEAELLLLQAMEGLQQHDQAIPANGRRHIEATLDRLIKLYESTDQPEEAARWRARLQEVTNTQPVTKSP